MTELFPNTNGFNATINTINGSNTGMFSMTYINKYGVTTTSKFDISVKKPIIPSETLTTLKDDYLEKFCENKNSEYSARIGSFQNLFIIINELGKLDRKSDYDILIVRVMQLFTSLIYKSQSQYLKIVLLTDKNVKYKNLLTIKKEEIRFLEAEVDRLNRQISGEEDDTPSNVAFSGSMNVVGKTLPNQLLFLMHIDIVKAWYYYFHGAPADCDMLDPNKVNEIFALLSEYRSLAEAKDALRKNIEEDEKLE
jgi:hypothetical protein